jgi:hypothetical protein
MRLQTDCIVVGSAGQQALRSSQALQWRLRVYVQQAASSDGKPQGSKLVKIGTINARHLTVLGVPGIGVQSLADALLRLVVLLLQLL